MCVCSPVLVAAFGEYDGSHKALLQQQFLSDFSALYEVGWQLPYIAYNTR